MCAFPHDYPISGAKAYISTNEMWLVKLMETMEKEPEGHNRLVAGPNTPIRVQILPGSNISSTEAIDLYSKT